MATSKKTKKTAKTAKTSKTATKAAAKTPAKAVTTLQKPVASVEKTATK